MSDLTVFLRDIGLGSVVDATDGVEADIKTAIADSPAVTGFETQTVDALGTAVQATVVGAIGTVLPGATTVAAEVTTPLLAGIEAFVLHFLQNATVTKSAAPAT